MRQFVLIYLRLAADFLLILSAGWSETPTLGMSNIPRLLLSKGKSLACRFQINPN